MLAAITQTILLASMHFGRLGHYHAYHYGYRYGHGGSGIGHMIANAAVHASVWMVIRQLFHGLGLGATIILALVICGIAYLYLRRTRAY